MDINYQCINNDQKLRNAFETSPTNLFIHFIDEDDEEKQDIENIELDQNKPWNEANMVAHTLIEEMIEEAEKGIVIVSTSFNQFARPNDRWFFQHVPFTMMINQDKYIRNKREVPPYVVYAFCSENITFDNVIIDGCVYVVDCVIDGTDYVHITKHIFHTRKSVIRYNFQPPVFTVLWPIDFNSLFQSVNNLCQNSNFDEAISLLRFILCAKLQTPNKSDIQLAYCFVWFSQVFIAKKDFDRSIVYNKKALRIRLDKLGPDHIDVGNVYYTLAIAYNEKGEYDKASDCHQQALEIRLKNLGDNHSDVAMSYDSLGRVYHMKAKYDQACELHEKALDIYSKQLDGNQINISMCYCHLGNALREKGEYVKSIEYHEKDLKISLEQLGEDHIDYGKSMFWLGMVYFEIEEYETSIGYLEQALDIQLRKLGKMQINKAKEYVDKALEILNDDKNNSFDLELAKSYDVLGLILEKSEKYEEAIQYFEKSLEIKFKKACDHPRIGWSFHYLASVFKNKNNLNKSIEYGEKALELRLNKLDRDHPYVGESYVLLGDIYLARGNKTKAKECYENALQIFNTRFGEQHQKTVRVRLILEHINE
ncbi:hypothetical protein RFI_03209, partial [Reticulomyxa filosa]